MAESGMSLSCEQVQRLLQCAICLDKFKRPKLLPCQHTFCLTPCLEGLIDHRTRSLRCPECRADHFIPRGGPANFPNNLTIIGFLSLSDTLRRQDEESDQRETSVNGSNQDTQLQQRAATPPRPQRQFPDMPPRAEGGCSVCRNETMILRCCHCDCLVCVNCHQDHMEQARRDLARLIGSVRRSLPHITDLITTIGRKEIQLQSRCESVKTEITEAVEKHARDLRARERSLHEDVDSFLAREIRGLRNCKENAEVEAASLSSYCDSSESLLGGRRQIPDGDIIEMKRQCEEYVDIVRAYEDGTNRPPNIRHIQAALESPFLSSTINGFGDLIITPGASHIRLTSTAFDMDNTQQFSGARSSVSPGILDTLAPLGSEHGSAPPLSERESDSPNTNSSYSSEENFLDRLGLSTSTTSPIAPRRREPASNQSTRPSQVTFAGDDTSRWFNLSQTMRSNRRSRQDRLSDTMLTEEARGPTLTQQMRDRTRHLSLGALVTQEEALDEEDPSLQEESDLFQPSSVPRRIGRRVARGIDVSHSYPGANFNNNYFTFSLNDNPQVSEDVVSPVSSNFGRHVPSIYVNSPRIEYNRKGAAVMRIGQRGSEYGEFIWPRGIAVSPLDDYIYVCDSSNHRVQIFDNAGRFFKWFGRYGQAEGEFDCLAGIAINGLGQVIIADRYNHRIQIFDRLGNFQKAFGSVGSGEGELNYPWGVACDNMGFIYVCDKENHRLQVFQSNGSFVRSFGEYGNRNGQLENPHYVSVSTDNKVYVSDSSNHRIQVFSIYGDFLFTFGGAGSLRGQMKFPRGIGIDNQGFAVVADSGNNRIQVFRADGRYYAMFGGWGSENGQFKGLEGLAIQANGKVIVSDRENHRIQIF